MAGIMAQPGMIVAPAQAGAFAIGDMTLEIAAFAGMTDVAAMQG